MEAGEKELSSDIYLSSDKRECRNLHFGMMKPPNNSTTNIDKLAVVVEATTVRRSDAMKRNMEIEVQ